MTSSCHGSRRFLAALDAPTVEALRSVFLHDALARLKPGVDVGGLWDRQATKWMVFDLDGTREAARQRALPQGPDLPPPQRRLSAVCAPGYTGRKRGEVVRTRTTLLQAHTHQWLFTCGAAGNGDDRGELVRGLTVIVAYQTATSAFCQAKPSFDSMASLAMGPSSLICLEQESAS
jgi:hypothetical protein